MFIAVRPISSQGQVTIPMKVRRSYLKLDGKDQIAFIENDVGEIVIKKATLELTEIAILHEETVDHWLVFYNQDPNVIKDLKFLFIKLGQAIDIIMKQDISDKSKLKQIEAAYEAIEQLMKI